MGIAALQTLTISRALPILRQLGAQSGSSMIRGGDFSMLKVWVGLEARSFLQASIDTVCLRVLMFIALLTSSRLNAVSDTTSCHRTSERTLQHTATRTSTPVCSLPCLVGRISSITEQTSRVLHEFGRIEMISSSLQ